ncbi:MAG: hypothetical protein ACRD4H_06640 [Candidatus Acidiferrales bacterium]
MNTAQKTIYCIVAFVLFPWHLGAQNKPAVLQPIDCTLIGSPDHECDPSKFAEVVKSAKTVAVVAIEAIPTWASVAERLAPNTTDREYSALRNEYFDEFIRPKINPATSDLAQEQFLNLTRRETISRSGVLDRIASVQSSKESGELQKYAEHLVRKWDRFQLVSNPDSADLVFEVRRYQWYGFSSGEDQPVSFVLVWEHRADPKTDNVLWIEKYQGHWKTSDTVASVVRQLRRDVQEARYEH